MPLPAGLAGVLSVALVSRWVPEERQRPWWDGARGGEVSRERCKKF